MTRQIQEVYAELGQVLESPEAFGLGQHVPPPLADRLESMRRMLQQALREQETQLAHERRKDYLDLRDDRHIFTRGIRTNVSLTSLRDHYADVNSTLRMRWRSARSFK